MKKLFFAILTVSTILVLRSYGLTDAQIMSKVVLLHGNGIYCTGELVTAPSGKTYILSAKHCKDIADEAGMLGVKSEDGKEFRLKILATDPAQDLLLIEGITGVEGLRIAGDLKRNEEVRTYTHGHGYDTYRTDGRVVSNTSEAIPIKPAINPTDCDFGDAPAFNPESPTMFSCIHEFSYTVITAFAQHGSSGGPVVNSKGELVGCISAVGSGYTYISRLEDIKRFLSTR